MFTQQKLPSCYRNSHHRGTVKGFPTLTPKYNDQKHLEPQEKLSEVDHDLPATGKMCLANEPLHGVGGSTNWGTGGRFMGHVCMKMNKSVDSGPTKCKGLDIGMFRQLRYELPPCSLESL